MTRIEAIKLKKEIVKSLSAIVGMFDLLKDKRKATAINTMKISVINSIEESKNGVTNDIP